MLDFYRQHGYAIFPAVFSEEETDTLIDALTTNSAFNYDEAGAVSAEALLAIPGIALEAFSGRLMQLAKSVLSNNSVPHQALILDKTKTMNWGLDWHQDLNIAVKKRIDVAGFTNWRIDAGVQQVIPPLHVLQNMVTVRLHLDDCDNTNGAIWVIPGSHTQEFITKQQIPDLVRKGKIIGCPVKKGGVMLMSPLLLHKSPYSLSDKSRRLLQVEYRNGELGGGIQWRYKPTLHQLYPENIKFNFINN